MLVIQLEQMSNKLDAYKKYNEKKKKNSAIFLIKSYISFQLIFFKKVSVTSFYNIWQFYYP